MLNSACCDYSYLNNVLKTNATLMDNNCIALIYFLNKGFVITFGQLYFRQSSASCVLSSG